MSHDLTFDFICDIIFIQFKTLIKLIINYINNLY